MNPSPLKADRFASPAVRVRELTPSETDHVSGGIVPVLIAAAIVAAVVQHSGDDSDASAQDED